MKTYLFFGQGNPGKNYNIRHNTGFLFLDRIVDGLNNNNWKTTDNYKIAGSYKADNLLLFVKPSCGYNCTGEVVLELFKTYNIDHNNLIVIHDDVDLSLCRVKVKNGGSSGGCNGIKSVDREIGTNQYSRIRIGVGRPASGKVDGSFVNGMFTDDEMDKMNYLFGIMSIKFHSLQDYTINDLRSLV